MMHELNTPADIAVLRDGTVFESLPSCLWPQRYAGMKWRKRGLGVTAVGPEGARSTTPIFYFRDPLPARVISDGSQEADVIAHETLVP